MFATCNGIPSVVRPFNAPTGCSIFAFLCLFVHLEQSLLFIVLHVFYFSSKRPKKLFPFLQRHDAEHLGKRDAELLAGFFVPPFDHLHRFFI